MLNLEIMNGPMDGQVIKIKETVEWGRDGEGELTFPWDEELGIPQAKFYVEEGKWWLEHVSGKSSNQHNMERLQVKVALKAGDIIKAANSWLLVGHIE